MRIITIITGIILVLASVWCFAHPGATFLSLAFILGIAMIMHGATSLFDYLAVRKKMPASTWLLTEGITTIIFGVVVLLNQLVTDAMITLFFGMWLMFSGAIRISGSIGLKKEGDKGWLPTLIVGVVGLLGGIYSFVNPIIAGIVIVVLVGGCFLLQGINMLTLGIVMPGRKNMKDQESEDKNTEEPEGKHITKEKTRQKKESNKDNKENKNKKTGLTL